MARRRVWRLALASTVAFPRWDVNRPRLFAAPFAKETANPSPPRRRLGVAEIVVLALTLLGLGLRVRGLVVPGRGLWIDEAFSVWLAELPPWEAVRIIAQVDQHPPLYALLLHLWLRLGDDPWWGRLSSALLGTATIPVVARLGWAASARYPGDETGRWLAEGAPRRVGAGVVAAALVAVSPLLVRYSQELRMYALVVLLAAVATLGLVVALERGTRGAWIGYGVATGALIFTHNVALLLLPAQAAFVLGRVVARSIGRSRRPAGPGPEGSPSPAPVPLRPYLTTLGVVGLFWLGWVPVLVHQASGVIRRFWISPPDAGQVGQTLLDFVAAFPPPRVTVLGASVPVGALGSALLIPFAALALVGLVASARRFGLLFLASFLGPVGIDLGLSLVRPIFQERLLLYAALGFLLLVAQGIAALRPRLLGGVLLGLALVLGVASVGEYNAHFQKEQWDLAAAYLADHARPGDLVLFNATWAQLPFDYYYRRQGGPALVEHGVPVDLFDRGELEPPMRPSDVPTIATLTAGRERVWVLLSHDWYNDPDHLIRPAVAALFPRAQTRTFGNIVIVDYRR